MFFWDLFRFGNEQNTIPFILLSIAEWTEWPEYGSLRIGRICILLGKFWREMIRDRLVTHRWLENCNNLIGIVMQNVYCGCRCAGLSSVSLPMLEQEVLIKESVLAWSKEMTNWKIQKTTKGLVHMAIFQHSVFQTFGKPFHSQGQRNWCMHRYNSSQITFANSMPFSEYVFFCKLIFRVFCYS